MSRTRAFVAAAAVGATVFLAPSAAYGTTTLPARDIAPSSVQIIGSTPADTVTPLPADATVAPPTGTTSRAPLAAPSSQLLAGPSPAISTYWSSMAACNPSPAQATSPHNVQIQWDVDTRYVGSTLTTYYRPAGIGWNSGSKIGDYLVKKVKLVGLPSSNTHTYTITAAASGTKTGVGPDFAWSTIKYFETWLYGGTWSCKRIWG